MTSIVSLDESGNMGSQDRYFVMSALIVKRSSDLIRAFKVIDGMSRKRRNKTSAVTEVKFSNSYPDERMQVLKTLSASSISIVYVAIDKKKSRLYRDMRNCDLYRAAVIEIMPLIGKTLTTSDVVLNFDENRCIRMGDLAGLVIGGIPDRNVKSVKKVDSKSDKAVQLADFISGSIREKYEHDDDRYLIAIEEKISMAHET